jgi:hypothetical protein
LHDYNSGIIVVKRNDEQMRQLRSIRRDSEAFPQNVSVIEQFGFSSIPELLTWVYLCFDGDVALYFDVLVCPVAGARGAAPSRSYVAR